MKFSTFIDLAADVSSTADEDYDENGAVLYPS